MPPWVVLYFSTNGPGVAGNCPDGVEIGLGCILRMLRIPKSVWLGTFRALYGALPAQNRKLTNRCVTDKKFRKSKIVRKKKSYVIFFYLKKFRSFFFRSEKFSANFFFSTTNFRSEFFDFFDQIFFRPKKFDFFSSTFFSTINWFPWKNSPLVPGDSGTRGGIFSWKTVDIS